MALNSELAEAVSKLVPGGRRAARVSAVLSVTYSVELEDGTRIAMAPSKPGSRETLQLAAAACASRACRLCGKVGDDDFVQSAVDGSWFCATCVREAAPPPVVEDWKEPG